MIDESVSMHLDSHLELSLGQASQAGTKTHNEDMHAT